ncbi:MAG: M23 family metallopeptidase [Bacteroidia bacterium]|nr:M23 family metallopeptidase [Bacteroidia bacterium]
MLLSAPFGQLRDNHFHSGLDIRTFEKEGLPVKAVADGWISRIKISAWGYGNAIYIDHPNGYTSVYAHLQRYNDSITEFVKEEQYRNESFEVEVFPRKNQLPIKRGDLIAFSGNSGGSTGPHLHFELRNTKTEYPINPLLFNMPVTDTLSPFFKTIAIYNLMPNRPYLIFQKNLPVKKFTTDTNFFEVPDIITLPQGLIGIGTEVYDYITDIDREQNIYTVKMAIDSIPYFRMDIESFSFFDTRYINTHIDFERLQKDRIRIQKCFIDDGNLIELYRNYPGKGKFWLGDTLIHRVQVLAKDVAGKASLLTFFIKGDSSERLSSGYFSPCSYERFAPEKDNTFEFKEVRMDIPKGALYDTLDFCYKSEPGNKRTLSKVYSLGDPYSPLSSNVAVSIKPNVKDSFLLSKMIIGKVSDKGYVSYIGGKVVNGWIWSPSRTFGDFALVADTVAPRLKFLYLRNDTLCMDTVALQIQIDDNLSGIESYRLIMDGKWVLCKYDPKNSLLIYEFDKKTPRNQKLNFELIVTDKKKNKSTLSKQIFIQ